MEQDPRVIRTQKLIIDAFVSLLQEKDFNGITVKDIASRATVNRTTFYAHFEDKYLLLEYIVTEAFEHIVLCRVEPDATLTTATIRNLILSMCTYQSAIYKDCHLNATSIHSIVENTVRKKLQTLIAGMLEQSQPEQNQSRLELMATIISSAIYDATKFWITTKQDMPAEQLADEILTFVLPKN